MDKKKCHERYHYDRFCYWEGHDDLDPYDCPFYWKIDDLLIDARHEADDEPEKEETEE